MNAIVLHRKKQRKARGFTAAEVLEAGLTCQQFEKLKFCWDPRRKTKYAENVKLLKEAAKDLPEEKPKKKKVKAEKEAPKKAPAKKAVKKNE